MEFNTRTFIVSYYFYLDLKMIISNIMRKESELYLNNVYLKCYII